VELLQPGSRPTSTVLTLFSQQFAREFQEWWYSRHPRSMEEDNCMPPSQETDVLPAAGNQK
jgi:hypothetical protein